MIKLDRPPCPPELTLRMNELTEEYKNSKKPVWKKKFITNPLLKMSNEKCCFCECKLIEEGKYMQVEHFHHKDEYDDEVVEWSNLLPICIRCNSHKRDHDTYSKPIIDPTVNDPKNHLSLSRFRIKGKDDLGKLTVEVLDLNDTLEIATPRFQVAKEALDKLDDIIESIDKFERSEKTDIDKAKIIRKVKALLRSCTATSKYSCVVSTVVLTDSLYDTLKSKLVSSGFWTEEMEKIEVLAKKVKLS